MICQIQNACRGFFSKTKSLKIILLTGSNNQFRNYKSKFPHFFYQLEQLLQVFFVKYQSDCYNFFENSGLQISKLVLGYHEQD